MNLIYICVFHQSSYVKLLKLLLTSLKEYGNIDLGTTDICIVTSQDLVSNLKESLDFWSYENFKFYILTEVPNTLFGAGCARLHIFSYENIDNYDKVLYLDTDILIAKDINVLFNLDISNDKLYALEEGTINHDYHGKQFFDTSISKTKISDETTAFTSGILFFRNSDIIKDLFNTILNHIKDHIENNYAIPICLDQPFIVYHSISENKYDNQLLKSYVENKYDFNLTNKIIYHFPYSPGNFNPKYDRMIKFYSNIVRENKSYFFDKIKVAFPQILNLLENKRFSWESQSIKFLKDFKMEAFGSGAYEFINSSSIKACFGHRDHIITFNKNFSEFVSVRKDDNEIIVGSIID